MRKLGSGSYSGHIGLLLCADASCELCRLTKPNNGKYLRTAGIIVFGEKRCRLGISSFQQWNRTRRTKLTVKISQDDMRLFPGLEEQLCAWPSNPEVGQVMEYLLLRFNITAHELQGYVIGPDLIEILYSRQENQSFSARSRDARDTENTRQENSGLPARSREVVRQPQSPRARNLRHQVQFTAGSRSSQKNRTISRGPKPRSGTHDSIERTGRL